MKDWVNMTRVYKWIRDPIGTFKCSFLRRYYRVLWFDTNPNTGATFQVGPQNGSIIKSIDNVKAEEVLRGDCRNFGGEMFEVGLNQLQLFVFLDVGKTMFFHVKNHQGDGTPQGFNTPLVESGEEGKGKAG